MPRLSLNRVRLDTGEKSAIHAGETDFYIEPAEHHLETQKGTHVSITEWTNQPNYLQGGVLQLISICCEQLMT